MPTYEYECKSCSFGFEVFQSMSEPPVKICPECGNEVRRLIFGGAGVIFKGSGFYVTDKSKSSGKDSKKTDSKQDSKAESESKSEFPAPVAPCAGCPNKGASASCPA